MTDKTERVKEKKIEGKMAKKRDKQQREKKKERERAI